MKIEAPISVGELFDKISVLDIKIDKFSHQLDIKIGKNPYKDAIANVQNERTELLELAEGLWSDQADVFYLALKDANKQIWDDVDEMHRLETTPWRVFKLAKIGRRIAKVNDERAAIKRKLNNLFKSEIVEEKLYQ